LHHTFARPFVSAQVDLQRRTSVCCAFLFSGMQAVIASFPLRSRFYRLLKVAITEAIDPMLSVVPLQELIVEYLLFMFFGMLFYSSLISID
jgi:hypothetical protein